MAEQYYYKFSKTNAKLYYKYINSPPYTEVSIAKKIAKKDIPKNLLDDIKELRADFQVKNKTEADVNNLKVQILLELETFTNNLHSTLNNTYYLKNVEKYKIAIKGSTDYVKIRDMHAKILILVENYKLYVAGHQQINAMIIRIKQYADQADANGKKILNWIQYYENRVARAKDYYNLYAILTELKGYLNDFDKYWDKNNDKDGTGEKKYYQKDQYERPKTRLEHKTELYLILFKNLAIEEKNCQYDYVQKNYKKPWRKWLVDNHPDKGGDLEVCQKMIEIGQFYKWCN